MKDWEGVQAYRDWQNIKDYQPSALSKLDLDNLASACECLPSAVRQNIVIALASELGELHRELSKNQMRAEDFAKCGQPHGYIGGTVDNSCLKPLEPDKLKLKEEAYSTYLALKRAIEKIPACPWSMGRDKNERSN